MEHSVSQPTLRDLLGQCRQYFVYTGVFSFAINILLLAPPLFMLQVFDRVMSSRSNETLVMLLLFFGFALLISGTLDSVRSRLFVRAGVAVQHLLRRPVFVNILQLRQQGSLNKHGLDDISILQQFISGNGLQALFEVPWIPIYFVVLYFFHPLLCVIAVIGAVTMSGLTLYEEKATAYHQGKGDDGERKAVDYIAAGFRNSEAVRAMGMQEALLTRWEKLHDKQLGDSVQAVDASAGIYATSKVIRNMLGIFEMAAAVALIINAENVTPGIMIASTIIVGRAMQPLVMVIGSWKHFIRARKAFERLDKMLESELGDETLLELPAPAGNLSVDRASYQIKQQILLRGINFSINAGEGLGIVGPSGSGKTTLSKLLLGIHKPADGCIRLDGVDVWRWANQGLGRYVGYLPQSVRLFPGTVAENIARLRDITTCPEAVIAAAKRARAHDMIVRLPKGYDTEVGEEGAFLSGGQRQLIGLARALFENPCFVVLDEPNANLDGEGEFGLRQLLRDMKKQGVTVVMIGHKPSLMSDMDKLLVLREGRQIMFGPRTEIMSKITGADGLEATGDSGNVQALR